MLCIISCPPVSQLRCSSIKTASSSFVDDPLLLLSSSSSWSHHSIMYRCTTTITTTRVAVVVLFIFVFVQFVTDNVESAFLAGAPHSDSMSSRPLIISNDTSSSINYHHQRRERPQLMCYTCMSKNIPDITKDILAKTVHMPESAQTDACNDPFTTGDALYSSVIQEPCDSACLKVVSENRYLKIVLRGCLTTIYKQISLQDFPSFVGTATFGSCDQQRQTSESIGEIVTDTCLCTKNYCNSAITNIVRRSFILFAVVIVFVISR